MAKPKQFPDRVALYLADGVLSRVTAAAGGRENMAAWLRAAVDAELERREKERADETPQRA